MDAKIIYARDTKVGEIYLTNGLNYKVKIITIYGEPPDVSSVLVESESAGERRITISGGTELIPYSEKLHVVPIVPTITKQQLVPTTDKQQLVPTTDKQQPVPVTNKQKPTKKKEKDMSRQKNPRSAIIDQELKLVAPDTKPDWEAIATLVIGEGRAPEEKRKAIINQAKMRFRLKQFDKVPRVKKVKVPKEKKVKVPKVKKIKPVEEASVAEEVTPE
jgi:hypothetical protein